MDGIGLGGGQWEAGFGRITKRGMDGMDDAVVSDGEFHSSIHVKIFSFVVHMAPFSLLVFYSSLICTH